MATQAAIPASEGYDITIRSSDPLEVVQAVVEGKPIPAGAPVEAPVQATKGETSKKEDTPAPAAPAPAVPGAKVDEPAEEPLPERKADETPEQFEARLTPSQKRINKAVAKQRDAERALEAEKARAVALEQQLADARRAPSKPADAAPATYEIPEPKPIEKFGKTVDDFDNLEAFLEARDEHRDAERQRFETETAAYTRAKSDREAQTREHERIVALDKQSIDEFRAAHPDYIEVLAKSTAMVSDAMRTEAARTGLSGPILYHLAQHPDKSTAIARMPDAIDQIIAIRDLAKELKAAAASPAPSKELAPASVPAASAPSRPTTAAPAPVTPVVGAAQQTRSLAELAKEDPDAYMREMDRLEEERRTNALW